MLGGHLFEILIVAFWLIVFGGGAYLLVRVVARTAAREAARTQEKQRRRGS